MTHAHAQDVKDLAIAEGPTTTRSSATNSRRSAPQPGIPIAPTLNAEFSARLAKLKSTSPSDFDAAYLDDMKSIHDKDEKLFAAESNDGTGDFKPFAAETDKIVKRHIGALSAF